MLDHGGCVQSLRLGSQWNINILLFPVFETIADGHRVITRHLLKVCPRIFTGAIKLAVAPQRGSLHLLG